MSDKELEQFFRNTCLGQRNAIAAKNLETKLCMRAGDLRRRINRLRRNAVPIASGSSGYYYARTAHEVYGTIRQLRQMQIGLQQAISGLEEAMRRFAEGGEGDGDGT